MWAELYDRTHGYLEPTIVDAPPPFPASFYAIADMFEGLRRDTAPRKMNYVRGYVNGREDYTVGERFLATQEDFAHSPDVIKDAIKTAFGGQNPRFGANSGMIVNGGLQWSEVLQTEVRQATSHIADLYKGRTISTDVTFFIGAYGATPFGVHVDDANHRTILFNFGPGQKGMAIWRNEDIHAQFGQVSNISDPKTIAASPSNYFFDQGSAFVLPSQRYHVGLNATLSTVAALVVELIDEGVAAAKEAQNLFAKSEKLHERTRDSLFQLTGYMLSRLHTKRLCSNGYLKYAIQKRQGAAYPLTPDTELCGNSKIQFTQHQLGSVGAVIYCRGKHHVSPVVFNNAAWKMLTDGQPFVVRDFLAATAGKDITLKDQLAILTFALQAYALKEDTYAHS